LFLALNGKRLAATDVDAIRITIALAAGEIDERQLAAWIRAHIRKR
jgi:prophage maintenance system killer protein